MYLVDHIEEAAWALTRYSQSPVITTNALVRAA